MNRLILRLFDVESEAGTSSLLADICDWRLVDAKGEVLAEAEAFEWSKVAVYLQEQGLSYAEAIFIPPSHRLHIARVNVPQAQRKHLDKILPFLMEETLGQSTDDLHFTILSRLKNDHVWVAVVDQLRLGEWITHIEAQGFFQPVLLPLACAYLHQEQERDTHEPKPMGTLLLATEGLDEQGNLPTWLLLDSDRASMISPALFSALGKEVSYRIFCQLEQQHLVDSLDTTQLMMLEHPRLSVMQSVSTYLYQKDAHWRSKNLCHGAFQRTQSHFTEFKRWRWVAGFAFIAFTLMSIQTQFASKELRQQEARIQQAANALFLELVPSEGRVVNLSRQLQGVLQQANRNGAASIDDSPYGMLAKIDAARAELTGEHRLLQLDYFDNTYRLEWSAKERESFDQLKNRLAQAQINLSIEQVARIDTGFRASMRAQMNTPE